MGVSVHVNDREVRTTAPVGSTLLDLLRDELDLTAAKPGCRTGDCGTCLVLVGSRPAGQPDPDYELHASCLTTLAMAAGCHVVTAEGLVGPRAGAPGTPDTPLGPVHRALLDAGAVQCGYCSPGLLVALTWALVTGRDPARAAAGSLCRCTGYTAVRRACDALGRTAGTGPVPLDDLLPEPVLRTARSLPALRPEHLGEHPGRWLAGATDEIPEHRHAAASHRRPTLLRRVPELGRIIEGPDWIELGAAVTVAQVQASALARRWPGLAEHLDQFGSPAVRCAATVGGNLVHASPTADLAVPLLAMAASAVVSTAGSAGTARPRVVPLAGFFLARHSVDLRAGEMLVAVRVPDPPTGAALHLERIAKRRLDDIASVSLAAVLRSGPDRRVVDARLAAGGVAPTPLLLARTADVLTGRVPDVPLARQALAALDGEISPIDDVRGSATYKRALLAHLVLAALDRVAPGLAEAVLPAGRPGPAAGSWPSGAGTGPGERR